MRTSDLIFVMKANNLNPDQTALRDSRRIILEQSDLGPLLFAIIG